MTAPLPLARALVATDGTPAADGALRIATALVQRDGTVLTAISVVEPVPYPLPVSDLAMAPPALPYGEYDAIGERRRTVVAQCERLGVTLPGDLLVACSVPLSGILFQATARKAELIILGLGRHRAVDRLFGTETALHAVRDAETATLAVPASATDLPRHAIVGLDFDGSSIAAARVAASLVGPQGRITLVHVDAVTEPLPAMLADWPPQVLDTINDAFERMIALLELPGTMQIGTIALAGHVGEELIQCASRTGADLIAVGRHHRNMLQRMVLGSATTTVVRNATCAVLVVPQEV